ncbi:MAG TPA: SDR family oxidoreductase [Gammaproteobacteria bacterium]|nr:SDR family oxidoreductase [Gammaproteobacteria bacterium]
MTDLKAKRGLVLGIANEHSIAYGCARAFRESGAELAITYLNERAEPYVRPLAEELEAPLILPCDVREPGQLEAVFERGWGRLDFVPHSIAYAPRDDLHARVVECSQQGFNLAMDVSVHSFIRMTRLAEQGIRVHALSPGPLDTRAASGIDRFDELMERARQRAPQHRLVNIADVGNVATFLVSDAASRLTGNLEYVDAGVHVME